MSMLNYTGIVKNAALWTVMNFWTLFNFSKSNSNNEPVGRPGIARSRAIQKRKETLLQEYKIRNKSNSFVDRRIGEKDAELSAEDKMIARFTMERMKNSGMF